MKCKICGSHTFYKCHIRENKMKQYQGSVVQVIDNNIIDNIPFVTGKKAEKIFLQICKEVVSNFDKYTKKDIDVILENGYEEVTGSGFIAINWFV